MGYVMSLLDEIRKDHAFRIALYKRVLKELAAIESTPSLKADMNSLEHLITELGGDARTGSQRVIRSAKERKT